MGVVAGKIIKHCQKIPLRLLRGSYHCADANILVPNISCVLEARLFCLQVEVPLGKMNFALLILHRE